MISGASPRKRAKQVEEEECGCLTDTTRAHYTQK